jgi:hypothetical protein
MTVTFTYSLTGPKGERRFLTKEEAAALEAQAAGRRAVADDPAARQQALTRGDIGS